MAHPTWCRAAAFLFQIPQGLHALDCRLPEDVWVEVSLASKTHRHVNIGAEILPDGHKSKGVNVLLIAEFIMYTSFNIQMAAPTNSRHDLTSLGIRPSV